MTFNTLRDSKENNSVNQFKIVVVGEDGSGKSSLVSRFLTNSLPDCIHPSVEDSYRKQVHIGSETCLLDILDTAGNESSPARDQYLLTSHGFVFVFSLGSRHSFERVYSLYKKILTLRDVSSVPMVLVGTKSDLAECDRQVTSNEGRETARLLGCPYIETSGLSHDRVKDVFHVLVHSIKSFDRASSSSSSPACSSSSKSINTNKKRVWDRLAQLSPFYRPKKC